MPAYEVAKASNSGTHRPIDLARANGISPQAVRNYERDGFLPAAERTPNGYRRYTGAHAAALRAYLALVAAHGYATAGEIMRAVHAGDVDIALRTVDHSHAQLLRDRATLDAVEAAIGVLSSGDVPASGPSVPLPISALAHRLGVGPASLRKWERAGILTPGRDPVTRYRVYSPADVRDADLAHLLRRGGYRLDHIATVLRHVHAAGGAEPLAASLHDWRQRLAGRARAMLSAAARLADYLDGVGDMF